MATCKPACELAHYRRSLSLSQIRSTKDGEGWAAVEFEISFSQLRETRMVQMAAMSIDAVTSSIGGAMDVCLGASLITLIELLLFLGQFLLKIIRRPKQN